MSQLASSILMVRPASFGYNAETAMNNAFQHDDKKFSSEKIAAKAVEEFDAFVQTLEQKNIDITVVQDTKEPPKPDAVFPNNWFCTLPNGSLIVFPMYAENRRTEKQNNVLQTIGSKFFVEKTEDWSEYEKQHIFLEGTGSLIFDHVNKIVYACLSQRTDKDLFEKFALKNGYKPVSFFAKDENNVPVYHTNVMMHVGATYAVICLDAVDDETEKIIVSQSLENTKHVLIPITQEQVRNFAGNMIQVKNAGGEKFTILSKTAFDSLTDEQKNILSLHTNLLPVNIETIETIGGGSARCMIAEIFLERNN